MPYKSKSDHRDYMRRWVARNRTDYLADKRCVKCGSRNRIEVDHVDPSKKVSHRIWSWSRERREIELAKCQVLCKRHHDEKTAQQRGPPPAHGTNSRYVHARCRCARCRSAHAAVNARYR